MLSLSEAYLAGLVSTSILYGISVTTYYVCVRALFPGGSRRKPLTLVRCVLFAVATGMWLDATVGVGQMLRHMLNAFVYYEGEGGADMGLSDIRDPMNIVHALTYPLQAAMGDSFLLYRTWVVYDHSWLVIAFPLCVLIGDLTAGFGITAAEFALHSTPMATATDPKIVPWTTAFFTLTLSLNVLCTGLIIGRIWRVTRSVSGAHVTESRVQQIGRIILESGLIYTTSSFIVLIVIVTRSNALYIASDSFIPITAICFHLIIIRTEGTREVKGTTMDSSRKRQEHMPVSLCFASYSATDGSPNDPMVAITEVTIEESGVAYDVSGTDGHLGKDRLWVANPDGSYDPELNQHVK